MKTLAQLDVDARIANHPGIDAVEESRRDWADHSLFDRCNDPDVALDLLTRSLWHTYIFGSITLPAFGEHFYHSLHGRLPLDDVEGKLYTRVHEMLQGELATGNIFQNDGTHAHYHDLRSAYEQAGDDMDAVRNFEADARRPRVGLIHAARGSGLWTPAMCDYASTVQRLTGDPLTTFLILTLSEETIPAAYRRILDTLPEEERFDPFRTFMERHIELDEGEHGAVTVHWLNHYVRAANPHERIVDSVLRDGLEFLHARVRTYN